jgi:hypothetical protein
MPSKRVYTDKEISAVLKRAAELHRTQRPTETSGLSLEELEQIGAEVGIDPDLVRAAARELDTHEPGKPSDTGFQWLGAPTSVDLERIVEGRITEAQWEEAVGEIQRSFGAAGETSQTGRTKEWVLRDQTGERAHVTVSPVGPQSRIRVYYRMSDVAWASYTGWMSVSVAPIIIQFAVLNLGPLLETGIAIAMLACFHLVARFAFSAFAGKQDAKARKLVDRLDNLIAAPEFDAIPDETNEKTNEKMEEEKTYEKVNDAESRIDASILPDDNTFSDGDQSAESSIKRTNRNQRTR